MVSLRFHLDSLGFSREKGNPAAGKREKGTPGEAKREKGKAARENFTAFPLGKRTARTHARTETEIDFPVGLTPPTSDTFAKRE